MPPNVSHSSLPCALVGAKPLRSSPLPSMHLCGHGVAWPQYLRLCWHCVCVCVCLCVCVCVCLCLCVGACVCVHMLKRAQGCHLIPAQRWLSETFWLILFISNSAVNDKCSARKSHFTLAFVALRFNLLS